MNILVLKAIFKINFGRIIFTLRKLKKLRKRVKERMRTMNFFMILISLFLFPLVEIMLNIFLQL